METYWTSSRTVLTVEDVVVTTEYTKGLFAAEYEQESCSASRGDKECESCSLPASAKEIPFPLAGLSMNTVLECSRLTLEGGPTRTTTLVELLSSGSSP